ncbi:MAG: thioesterase [bacterium]|nr:thioesterase [bacterium]MDT8396900.1 thioesterase [bacterium]
MPEIHEINYTVRPYEAGYGKTLKPEALLNYLQDAAFEHSYRRGISLYHFVPLGLTWVLTRYHVEVERDPAVGERVTVRTWYPGAVKPYYLRDWEIVDSEGITLVRATSSWLIIDMKRKGPSGDNGLLDGFPPHPVRSLEDDFAPLPEMESVDAESTFCVRLSDTDLNRHVNHVHYIQWALDSVPAEVMDKKLVTGIEVGYRGEARFGDKVISKVGSGGEGLFLHQLVRESDGKELTRLRTKWG